MGTKKEIDNDTGEVEYSPIRGDGWVFGKNSRELKYAVENSNQEPCVCRKMTDEEKIRYGCYTGEGKFLFHTKTKRGKK